MTRESDGDGGDRQLYEMKSTSVKIEVDELNIDFLPEDNIDNDPFLSDHGAETTTTTVGQKTALGRSGRKRKNPNPCEDLEDEDLTPPGRNPRIKKALPPQKKDALTNRQRQRRTTKRHEEKEKCRLEKQQQKLDTQLPEEESGLLDGWSDNDDDKKEDKSARLRRTSRRAAKVRSSIKNEPMSAEEDNDDSADQDYKLDDNDKDFKIKTTARKSAKRLPRRSPATKRAPRRKKASEMTEEERLKMREKWREERRVARARKRAQVKTDTGNEDEDKKCDSGTTVKRESAERKSRGSYSWSSSRRKKMEEMTEEQREAIKAKWREEARIKRAQMREAMTPQQREEYLREQRERKQVLRALAREAMSGTDQEPVKRKNRERKAKTELTPEQKRERSQRMTMQRIERRAAMTDEEKETMRMKLYFQRMARLGRMTSEEKEQRRKWQLEYLNKRKQQMKQDPKLWEEYKQRCRKYRRKQQERIAELKKDPAKREELQQKSWLKKQEKIKRTGGEAVKKERRPYILKKHPDETPEQKEKRLAEMRKVYRARQRPRKRLNQIRKEMADPEVRERELLRQRINWAKRNLRQRLEAEGVLSPEEIQKRVEELQHTYQPKHQFRQFKPRSDILNKMNEIDPKLSDEIKKNLPHTATATLSISSLSNPPKQNQSVKASTSKATRQKTGNLQENSRLPTRQNLNNGISRSGPTSQAQFPSASVMNCPPQISSPAGDSSCSYVSVTETHKAVDYTTSQPPLQLYHLQQQSQPQRHPHATNQYSQQYPYQVPVHSLQQPQPEHHQYSLQHLLDGITFQESGTGIAAAGGNQVNYEHENHAHPNDYASSYGDNHSAPGSPGGGENDDEDYSFNRPPPPSSSTNCTARKPRTGSTTRKTKHIGTKRGTKSKVAGIICDECGVAYADVRAHKLKFHNPNYKDKTCQLCGEEFNAAKQWYSHYKQTHFTPEVKHRPYVCEFCGDKFRKKLGLDKHRYYTHGDGLKKENWNRCPVCPGEKLFKNKGSFHRHLKMHHPDYTGFGPGPGRGRECYRCDRKFPEEEMSLHVQQEHPNSYFPCEYCNSCRFTQLGLNYHYTICTKIDKATKDKMKKTKGMVGLDRKSLPCEICGTLCFIYNLTRHYWVMHNVKEDAFTCQDCGKEFSRRDKWVVHLEEKHLKSLEEMKDAVRCLNAQSREGLVIKKVREPAFNFEIEMRPAPVSKSVKAKGGRRPNKRVILDTSDDEEEEEEEETVRKGARGDRRNITVVAEEDKELGLEGCSDYAKESYWRLGGNDSENEYDGHENSSAEGRRSSARLRGSLRGKLRENESRGGRKKKKREYTLKRYPNETPEEKAKRLAEQKKKYRAKDKSTGRKRISQIRKELTDPEARKRELWRQRINWAKRDLRKRLEAEGVPPEEIQRRVEELQHTYQPKRQYRVYKPRSNILEKVNPSDVALMEQIEKIKASSSPTKKKENG